MSPAVVLLSGGLDSATVLAVARVHGFEPVALSFRYGQRHHVEIEAARKVVQHELVRRHEVLDIALDRFGGSSLTNHTLYVPLEVAEGIPSTYVPARNTVFLACALALAEVVEAQDIFIGVNAVDYSGYPDCRPVYIEAFERMANLATVAATEHGRHLRIHAPLMTMSKTEIIRWGVDLGVDYALTVSCYQADERGACGECDSCRLRLAGFEGAGLVDPALYRGAR